MRMFNAYAKKVKIPTRAGKFEMPPGYFSIKKANGYTSLYSF